jgi:DNA-binding NtrC family response regulator
MKTENSILIIEDDIYMNKILNEFLKSEGIKSESAYNYKEAIKKIKKKKYSMLILDYNINGFKEKNGIDVYEFARSLYPGIKGILITAFGNKSVKDKAKEKGINQILDKPFSFDELAGFIKLN